MKKVSLPLILLTILAVALGETQVSVSVSATSATIGERITLKFIVRTPGESDSIRIISREKQEFEFLKEGALSVTRKEGLITFEKDYEISFFKTGEFNAGPFIISLLNGDTEIESRTSNSIPVRIRSVLEKGDEDIKPLKDLPEIDGNPLYLLKYLIILGLIAGLIILAVYLVRRIKKSGASRGLPPLPPDLEFLNRIEALWRTDLLRTGKIKRFFLTLTESYKQFMTRLYQFNAEDLTTHEIVNHLQKHETEARITQNFDRVFLISDLAKFAKYVPSEEEVSQIRADLHEIIAIAGERRRKQEEEARNASS